MHVCVIDLDASRAAHLEPAGHVRCMGQGAQLVVPEHLGTYAFTEVAVGVNHVCALRVGGEGRQPGGRGACWGNDNGNQFGQISKVPELDVHSLCAGSYYSCALTLGSTAGDRDRLVCWGESEMVRAVERGAAGREVCVVG